MRQTSSSGQSMLEILIGSTLVVVVLLAGVILSTKSIQMSEASAAREKAIQLAREGVEEMRGQRNAMPWSMFIAQSDREDTFQGKIVFTRSVVIDQLAPTDPDYDRVCNIEVIVSWVDAKGNHEVTQRTMLANW